MKAMKKQSKTVKIVLLGLTLSILIVGGYFAHQYYKQYQANRIYSTNETVSFPDFNIAVTKAEFKAVDLPINKKDIAQYGSLAKTEDCTIKSKVNTWDAIGGEWGQYGPSAYNVCVRRNDSRDAINKYSAENTQLVVNYKIMAINNVDAKKIKVEINPDSGRNLNAQVDSLNGNQFLDEILGAQHIESAFQEFGNAPGPVYTDEPIVEYKPYHKSNLGGDINKGLERTGYLYTDIRNSEHSVDIKITYNSDTRIVRITH